MLNGKTTKGATRMSNLTREQLLAFNKYFLICRDFYQILMQEFIYCNKVGLKFTSSEEVINFLKRNPYEVEHITKVNQYEMLFYAALNSLVEGWKMLKCEDNEIDNMLIEGNLEKLNQFRNKAFHFQKVLAHDHYVEFITNPDLKEWAFNLYDLIKNWLHLELTKLYLKDS